ncbi:hypothetical protein CEXT_269821 [Caerostris extrusa]|uniref:Uncharacterized protein n=1 Tax=Caerostris extrusa TaxID=172846 RepID=A0AAV4VEQ4_CAEEX|nr:hypothetical protein CEXT_269821 [Caerostris extrusa]
MTLHRYRRFFVDISGKNSERSHRNSSSYTDAMISKMTNHMNMELEDMNLGTRLPIAMAYLSGLSTQCNLIRHTPNHSVFGRL